MIKAGIYKHYKGNLYEVVALASHSETLEDMVIYKPLDGGQKFWVRPLYMWDNEIVQNGVSQKRFEFVSDPV